VEDISFDLRPALTRRGIQFRHERAERIQPERNVVVTESGEVPYDYLVIATGPQVQFDIVPGLGSHNGGYTHSICAPDHAEHACQAWEEFLKDPGPVVVGATQGASCFGEGNGSARPRKQPFGKILGLCILDAGNQGIVMTTDHIFRPRKVELLIPGPWSHWAKLAFEKYYLWRMKGGYTYLP
jgi:hypothetical protein